MEGGSRDTSTEDRFVHTGVDSGGISPEGTGVSDSRGGGGG